MTVRVDAELLAKAERLGIDISEILQRRLRQLVGATDRETWLRENRAAIEQYNARIETEGTFGDHERLF